MRVEPNTNIDTTVYEWNKRFQGSKKLVICLFWKQTLSYPRPRLTLVKIELSGISRKGK